MYDPHALIQYETSSTGCENTQGPTTEAYEWGRYEGFAENDFWTTVYYISWQIKVRRGAKHLKPPIYVALPNSH